VLDDGTVPSEPVRIQRVCSGNLPRPEGYSDGTGRFSIQLGQSNSVLADASEQSSQGFRGGNSLGGIRQSDLAGCEIQASLPGFRSDVISLANRRSMDDPDVGTIVLHRIGTVDGLTTSATAALAPKDARKDYEKGLEAVRKNKPDEAQKEFEKAVELYPKYAAAWFELGKVNEQQNQEDAARKAYAKALTADSKYLNPYERLYLMAFKAEKWQELADTTDHVLRINPYDFPSSLYYNAVANLQLKNLDLAEQSARAAVKLDSAHRIPKTGYVLGLILAVKRDFAESARYLRGYLAAAPNAPDADQVRKQLGQVEQLLQTQAQSQPPN
jgi:tetratricopeptide (TPR) repeat protein